MPLILVTHGLAALLAALLTWSYLDARHDAAVGEIRVEQANAVAAAAGRARAAEKREREKEQQWATTAAKEAFDAQTKINALQSDIGAARGAAERLRVAAAGSARRAREAPGAPGAGQGVPGADTLDLLVGVLQRHSDELVAVGAYADQLRVAGDTCERISDAVTP